MSIKLMTAAWEVILPTTPKMVLLALCDNANELGKCFPSVRLVARKSSLSERQCQRVLHQLEKDRWITVVGNPTGGRGSKRYQINMEKLCSLGGGVMPAGRGDTHVRGDKTSPVSPMSPEGVTSTSPVSPMSPEGVTSTSPDGCRPCHPNRHTTISRTATTIEVAESLTDRLVYPQRLSPPEVVVVDNFLSGLDRSLQQPVLDELAGAMSKPGGIKSTPVAFARALAVRARKGEFHPSLGIEVAKARERSAAKDARRIAERITHQRRQEATHSESARRAMQACLAEVGMALGTKEQKGTSP